MSKASKISAIAIGLAILSSTAFPVFAENTSGAKTNSSGSAEPVKILLPRNTDLEREKAATQIGKLKEKHASRTAELKEKLQVFKDKVKATLAEKVNENLNRINKKETEQMQKHLNTMTTILDKLESRKDLNASSSSALKDAITNARTNISTASAAVTTQAQRDYTINITTESKIKADAKSQRDKLHADLQAVRKIVINTKQSVANAIRAARPNKTTMEKVEKEGTNSGKQ